MLKIRELHIENFKNIGSVHLEFDTRFICFVGENGAGKTNLLDAIYYASMGKSYYPGNDSRNIRFNHNYFNIRQINDLNGEITEIFIALVNGGKKKIKANQTDYEKISDHIGRYPVVMVTPYDLDLIDSTGKEKRKFIDRMISQINRHYLLHLMTYNKAVIQRNALLKWMNEKGKNDKRLLQTYDKVLQEHSEPVYRLRTHYIAELNKIARDYYAEISKPGEQIELSYISVLLETTMEKILENEVERDIGAGKTTSGIHKDDIRIELDGKDAQFFASQGQKKSIVLAIKLAEYSLIKQDKKFSPVLLLDDLTDKLDEKRFKNLLHLIAGKDFGQIFITDTSKDKLSALLSAEKCDFTMFEVRKGEIINKT